MRSHDACEILTLAPVGPAGDGVDSGAAGSPSDRPVRHVIAPFDIVEPIARPAQLRLVTRRRWRRACRALLADHTPPGALRSGRRARIDLLPHQLEPALAVVRGLGSRLLLADAVGLGKTIQAGLVLAELRARACAERALILTPAGLREQWAGELVDRFGITAAPVDARDVRRRVAALPVGVNPWATLDVAIASIDYVKRPDVFAAVASCRWDVLIVDEAHGVAGDSDRHEVVAALAACSPYVILLTATPHSGDRRAFLSLCRLGQQRDSLLIFRRTREDVRLGAGRRVRRLMVRPSAAEMRMHACVARFSRAVLEDKHDDDSAAWLAVAVLNKRALSSARSLEQTVERRLAAVDASAGRAAQADADRWQPALPLADADGDTDDADRAPDLAGLTFGNPARERTMLRELAAAARLAARRETKIAALVRLLDRIRERVIVFTEYRDTLLRLRDALPAPAAVLHGGLDRDARLAALDDFVSGRHRVLLATDAAGEGLNLHQACRIVVTLELPWNPMRLEQRIGRVDRIGQRRTVHAVHLIGRDTGETRMLDRLRTRIAQAQADVGAPDPLGPDEAAGGDDRAVVRLLIEGAPNGDRRGREEARAAAPSDAGVDGPVSIALNHEADAEATRLGHARRIAIGLDAHAGGWLQADGGWLSFSRASGVVARTRILLMLGAAYEDESGRLVESTLIPVAIACGLRRPPPEHRRLVDEVVRFVMAGLPMRLDQLDDARRLDSLPPGSTGVAALASWREAAVMFTRVFFDRRLARQRAIAAAGGAPRPGAFQPGLFDRRAARQVLVARAGDDEAGGDMARRLVALEHASRMVERPATLLLVLAP